MADHSDAGIYEFEAVHSYKQSKCISDSKLLFLVQHICKNSKSADLKIFVLELLVSELETEPEICFSKSEYTFRLLFVYILGFLRSDELFLEGLL